jgi:hypothetical protein
MSLRANQALQGSHHAFLRTELAPRFQARDILLVRKHIHKCPAGLITVPTAHPCREVTRHRRRHCQILGACKRVHIDGDLRICSHRKKRDCKCCTNQSKLHLARPFRCCTICIRGGQGIFNAAFFSSGQFGGVSLPPRVPRAGGRAGSNGLGSNRWHHYVAARRYNCPCRRSTSTHRASTL